MSDENSVIVSGTVHSHESRDWQDKTFWSVILSIAGEREFDGVTEDTEDFVKIRISKRLEKKLADMPVGTHIRVEGALTGRLGTNGGCFMEIVPKRFSRLGGAAVPPPSTTKAKEMFEGTDANAGEEGLPF